MYSITYGEVSFEEMYTLIKAYLSQDKKWRIHRLNRGGQSEL